ncbi:hypothetical protein [Bacillus massilinigeriensis]|uniref:hypothetical protein n=1 Tax=Bacillus mediterraneensis TaxID=1805474 RepID=UPI0008F8B365|nr:hypothetical protein [Bacillus mediterraneensis]
MNSESSDKAPLSSVDLEEQNRAIKKLATNLFSDESTLDVGSIMRMATSLISSEDMMNTVKLIGGVQNEEQDDKAEHAKQEGQETNLLLKEIREEMAAIKLQLISMQSQNEYMKEILMHMMETSKKKRWWNF